MSKKTGRVIFIGDVHGCIHEFSQLLDIIQPKTKDRIIQLGDIIGKGPDSNACIRLAQKLNIQVLLGNHEYFWLKKMSNYKLQVKPKSQQTMKDRKTEQKIVQFLPYQQWMQSLPNYIDNRYFVAVHAGFHPTLGLKNTPKSDLLSIRTIHTTNTFATPWFYYYADKKPVFFGHWAKLGYFFSNRCTCLDSGCVYGGSLSALIFSKTTINLEQSLLLQIPASQVYEPIRTPCTEISILK